MDIPSVLENSHQQSDKRTMRYGMYRIHLPQSRPAKDFRADEPGCRVFNIAEISEVSILEMCEGSILSAVFPAP